MTIDSERAAATSCARAFREAPERYHGRSAHRDVDVELRDRTPPRTNEGEVTTPMFGSAGSGGAEFEPIPEEDEEPEV
jgi:hypothetical protein